ncbi:uncharacterized protein PV09_01937 [Verruconis gallopava]|uniref:Uncharacterized protein n=1 Tax=Verruconis gallopava TaxID=253628 RepID=A0A0D2AKG6_9PEZI|nr:uncharacterized protein PV09_01937 [Verruconis gallopava]KIW07045.1 hypothetical protein PV09_01937 [Verruconis gallopava]
MSGLLGLIETDILYAEPGTEQAEKWRIAQSILGIGSLRVLSKICRSPCFEILHQMYGIQPPESKWARDFWLAQRSWTELALINMTSEDTSYHRVNQGTGPQAKVLWTWDEICAERIWWAPATPNTPSKNTSMTGEPLKCRSDSTLATQTGRPAGTRGDSIPTSLSAASTALISDDHVSIGENSHTEKSHQKSPLPPGRLRLFPPKNSTDITEGTTDKWWMDRWQCEFLAVAALHNITNDKACEILTAAYFGYPANAAYHIFIGALCITMATATFIAGVFSDWSWCLQFTSLTSLGYFVNRTACLRAWKFEPNAALKNKVPEILQDWPSTDEGKVVVRFATQSSGICNLRVLIAFERQDMDAAKDIAQKMKGRYRSLRKAAKEDIIPYAESGPGSAPTTNWLSYEVQSTFYGLAGTVMPDNVALRSMSVVASIPLGIILLMLGFGSTAKKGWNSYILIIYIAGIVCAIFSRSRTANWTMPEFEVVDLTRMVAPPVVAARLENFIADIPQARPLLEQISRRKATSKNKKKPS